MKTSTPTFALAVLNVIAVPSVLAAQSPMPTPAFVNTFNSSTTRGFHFQAPLPFIITGLEVPDESGTGIQNVEVIVQDRPFVLFGASTVGTTAFVAVNQPSGRVLPTGGIFIDQGDYVGILGACGTTQMANSYGGIGPFMSSVEGIPVQIDRFLTQSNLFSTGGMQPVSTELGLAVGRVDVHTSSVAGFAIAQGFGESCGGTEPASFYEVFDAANRFDLANSSLQMAWPGASYIVAAGGAGITTPVNPVAFGNNTTLQFPLPTTMPTETGDINAVSVCSNGWIAFERTTATDFSETVDELINQPLTRIAALWDDLDPAAGGQMYVDTTADMLRITWQDVPERAQSNANSFQIELNSVTGDIAIHYGAIAAADCLVGYSPRVNQTDPGPSDIDVQTGGPSITLGSGVPDLRLTTLGRPVIGGPAATLNLTDFSTNAIAGTWLIGTQSIRPGVSLAPVGAPGCLLSLSPNLGTIPFAVSGSAVTLGLGIPTPANGSFVGVDLFWQAAVVDFSANPLGVVTSNGMRWKLENS